MDYTVGIRIRRGTSSQWSLSNPILADGEPGFATNFLLYKIGDGETRWNDLPWVSGQKGDSSSVTIGVTSTGEPGTQAVVVNSGTDQDAVLDFTIPEGIQGDPGATGPSGPPGGSVVDAWWFYNDSTVAPPSTGQVGFSVSSASVNDSFSVYLSHTDNDGLLWDNSIGNVAQGDLLYFKDREGGFWLTEVDSSTNNVGWAQLQVTLVSSNIGSIKNDDRLQLAIVPGSFINYIGIGDGANQKSRPDFYGFAVDYRDDPATSGNSGSWGPAFEHTNSYLGPAGNVRVYDDGAGWQVIRNRVNTLPTDLTVVVSSSNETSGTTNGYIQVLNDIASTRTGGARVYANWDHEHDAKIQAGTYTKDQYLAKAKLFHDTVKANCPGVFVAQIVMWYSFRDDVAGLNPDRVASLSPTVCDVYGVDYYNKTDDDNTDGLDNPIDVEVPGTNSDGRALLAFIDKARSDGVPWMVNEWNWDWDEVNASGSNTNAHQEWTDWANNLLQFLWSQPDCLLAQFFNYTSNANGRSLVAQSNNEPTKTIPLLAENTLEQTALSNFATFVANYTPSDFLSPLEVVPGDGILVDPQKIPGSVVVSQKFTGPYFLVWNGTDWNDIQTGKTTQARPNIPAYPEAWVVWSTVDDPNFTDYPPLATDYDDWKRYLGGATTAEEVPVFFDDFTGSSLNTDIWGLYNDKTSEWGRFYGELVTVGNSHLQLTCVKNYDANTPQDTYAIAGCASYVNTRQYGRYEARVKLPGDPEYPGSDVLRCVALLWPTQPESWYTGGEIDFMEVDDGARSINPVTIHSFPNYPPDTTAQRYHDSYSADFRTRWQNVGVIWNETSITYTLNGIPQATRTNPGLNKSMHIALQHHHRYSGPQAAPTGPNTSVMLVDWVKIWSS